MKRYIVAMLYTWYIMLQTVAGPILFNWYNGEFQLTLDQQYWVLWVLGIITFGQGIFMVILWRAAILNKKVSEQF